MSDAAKILYDLASLTNTLDLDRADLANISMTAEQRKDIQHHVVRCLHGLYELEIVLEGLEPDSGSDADFLV